MYRTIAAITFYTGVFAALGCGASVTVALASHARDRPTPCCSARAETSISGRIPPQIQAPEGLIALAMIRVLEAQREDETSGNSAGIGSIGEVCRGGDSQTLSRAGCSTPVVPSPRHLGN